MELAISFRLNNRFGQRSGPDLTNEKEITTETKQKATTMKTRNHRLLDELNIALYKEDPNNKKNGTGEDPATGGGAAGDTGVTGDFVMNSGSDACPGCQVGYNERVTGGSGSSTTRPIHHEDEPERAILLMDLPKPFSDWTMKVTVDNGEMKDVVDMTTESGSYEDIYANLTAKYDVVHEEEGFFTVYVPDTESPYLTYMNMNQDDQVIRLTTLKKNTFDVFRVSFLVLATN